MVLPRASAATGSNHLLYLKTASNQFNAQFSPDGKWIAYTSDESGQQEIYRQSFPANQKTKWQVSNGGGNLARWRRNGKELYYPALDGWLTVASVREAGRHLEFGTPNPLLRILEPSGPHTYRD